MMLTRPLIVDGEMWGVIYTLEEIGDELPVHVHDDETTNHITILSFGKVECLGHPKFNGRVIEAKQGGTILNWTVGEPHGLRAVTKGATFVNLLKVRGG